MTGEGEISEAGRKARFEQWRRLGLDRVKHDLLRGAHRLVGGPPQVQELAWEWVRIKEAEAARAVARQLSPWPSIEDTLSGRDPTIEHIVKSLGISQETPLPSPRAKDVAPALVDAEPEEKRREVLILKPTLWGIGIDLKEAGRRLRRLFKQS
jgi:hypothetical protein